MTENLEWIENKELADKILELRLMGKIDDAINLSKEAEKRFPKSYFFPKITGDLLFQSSNYDAAAEYFLRFLQTVSVNYKHPEVIVSDFAKRYYRLRRVQPQEKINDFAKNVLQNIKEGKFNEIIAQGCLDIITPDIPKDIELSADGQKLISLLSDDANFVPVVNLCKKLETENPVEIEIILDNHILNRKKTSKTRRIDTYAIASYERIQKNEKALQVAVELVAHPIDGVLIRSILRICRKLQNYQKFDLVLNKHPEILKSDDFNVLYELVYYFEAKNDFIQVQSSLNKIERSAQSSVPILQTLRNFYGRFGLLDDVARVTERISELQAKKGLKLSGKFNREVQESEEKVWLRI